MEIAIQTRVLYNNQIRTIDRFLGNIQTWPQTGFLCSIDPKFVRKFLFNILLFARNSNTNRVSSSNFPLWHLQPASYTSRGHYKALTDPMVHQKISNDMKGEAPLLAFGSRMGNREDCRNLGHVGENHWAMGRECFAWLCEASQINRGTS